MSLARRWSVVLATALALVLVTTGHPADAAVKRPSITLKASPTTVALQSSTTLAGKVSGKSSGATVKLQRKAGGSWRAVKSTQVKRNKRYRFTVAITARSTAFRVKVVKNKRLGSRTSRTVKVTGAPTSPQDAARAVILQKTNEFRAQNGRPPLALMPELSAVAQDWSVHMALNGVLDHRPGFETLYPAGWTAAGENVAAGQRVEDVVDAWISSPGHRENLLGPYNYIGIGYATGGTYGRSYTQNFAQYPHR